ncbi:MAG: hypothetical protein ACLSHO_12710 [Dysosmobacter sp.]
MMSEVPAPCDCVDHSGSARKTARWFPSGSLCSAISHAEAGIDRQPGEIALRVLRACRELGH